MHLVIFKKHSQKTGKDQTFVICNPNTTKFYTSHHNKHHFYVLFNFALLHLSSGITTVPIKRQKKSKPCAALTLICIKTVCSMSSSAGAMQSFHCYESPVSNSVFHFWNKLDLPRCLDDVNILVLCILFEWQNEIIFCAKQFFSTETCCSVALY